MYVEIKFAHQTTRGSCKTETLPQHTATSSTRDGLAANKHRKESVELHLNTSTILDTSVVFTAAIEYVLTEMFAKT